MNFPPLLCFLFPFLLTFNKMVTTPVNSHRRSIISKMTTTSIRVGSEDAARSSSTSTRSREDSGISIKSTNKKPNSLPKIDTKQLAHEKGNNYFTSEKTLYLPTPTVSFFAQQKFIKHKKHTHPGATQIIHEQKSNKLCSQESSNGIPASNITSA